MPFDSLYDDANLRAMLEDLQIRVTRILISTLAVNVGLDMTINTVIVAYVPTSFETLVQWGGRARQFTEGRTFIVYADDWMRLEGALDLDGDPAGMKKKGLSQKLAAQKKFWEAYDPETIDFLNPLPVDCC